MRKLYCSITSSGGALRQKDARLVLFWASGTLAAGLYRIINPYLPDDAYITYRYAENLAGGLGLTYHAGERILGTTAPFFALLLSGGVRLGMSPVYLSGLIDFLAFGGSLYFILKIAGEIAPGFWRLWLLAVLILSPSYISLTGMETWLYSFFIYFTFWSLMKKNSWGISIGSVICALMRPDGFLVWMIAFAVLAYRYFALSEEKRKALRAPILAGLLLLFTGLLLPTLYFGAWLPESVFVKQDQVGIWKSYFRMIFEKYHYANGFPTPLTLVMLGGLALGFARHPRLAPFLIWGMAYQLFLISGRAPWYEWYETPVVPWFFLCVMIFWLEISGRSKEIFEKKAGGANALWIRPLILILSLVCLLPVYKTPQTPRFSSIVRFRSNIVKSGNVQAGKWIAERGSPDAKIAAIEIGALGYYSGWRMSDLLGVVTPGPSRLHRRTNQWEMAWERNCEYVAYPFANLPGDFLSVPSKIFWRNYRIEKYWSSSYKRKVYDITILFGKHAYEKGEPIPLSGNLSAPLRDNATGVVILDLTPHTALKGVIHEEPPQRASWTFIGDSMRMKLEFTPTFLPPCDFEGECLIEEGLDSGVWEESFRFPVSGAEPIRREARSSKDRPLIRITIFPDRFPESQGFYLLDAETTSLE